MRNLSSKQKKGQVSLLAPAILALVFAGIVLVFGIVMSQELRDTQTGTETFTVTNQTVNNVNAAITTVKNLSDTVCGYTTWNATKILNLSIGFGSGAPTYQTLVEGTHYVINASTGEMLNKTATYNTSLVTYYYYSGGEACDAANLTVHGLGSFADFWEIIVLAIVITIVIGLLLVIFGGRKNR